MSKDAQNWFVGLADVQNAIHQMRILGWLWAFLALPAVLASDVGHSGKKKIERKRLVPDSLKNPVPTTLPFGFFLGDVFL